MATQAHPIIMSSESVRAILNGRKTQTRRVIKPRPGKEGMVVHDGYGIGVACVDEAANSWAHYKWSLPAVGGLLWVRETWRAYGPDECACYDDCHCPPRGTVLYRAAANHDAKWCSPIYMPRWASRITLRVTDVRVERLNDISEGDAIAEGCGPDHNFGDGSARAGYAMLWNSLNAKRGYSWESNPWVKVIEFERVERCQD